MKLEARITRMVGDEKLKAYASVVINDSFIITGITEVVLEAYKQKLEAL